MRSRPGASGSWAGSRADGREPHCRDGPHRRRGSAWIHTRPVAGLPLIHVESPQFQGWRYLAKRALDIVGSIVGIILTSPILVLIPILIRIDSPGPVLLLAAAPRPARARSRCSNTARCTSTPKRRAPNSSSRTRVTACSSRCVKTLASRRLAVSSAATASTRSRSSSTCSRATCRSSGPATPAPPGG